VIAAFPDLASDVVKLRAWSASDVDALVSACNDGELRERLGVPNPYTPADALAYVGLCADGWVTGAQFTFAVIDRTSGIAIGSVRVGPSPAGATAGYWTAASARGRGFASAALWLVTGWALDQGLTPVRLYVAPDNVASQRVALNAGYRVDENAAILDPEGVAGDFVYVTE
jgi:Acetyltransferases, including N-acetylases of ribosomal proteins